MTDTSTPPSDAQLEQLVDVARTAQRRAYAPYSRFAVGAALLDEQGRIHGGCNVENAAYPEGLCAEAVAIGLMVLAGGTRIVAAAVAGDAPQPVTPCGGCRQKLREFAGDELPVWSANGHEVLARHTLGELLPASFGPDHLGGPTEPRAARRAAPNPARIPTATKGPLVAPGDRPTFPTDEGQS